MTLSELKVDRWYDYNLPHGGETWQIQFVVSNVLMLLVSDDWEVVEIYLGERLE